jgi:hypothetical protein
MHAVMLNTHAVMLNLFQYLLFQKQVRNNREGCTTLSFRPQYSRGINLTFSHPSDTSDYLHTPAHDDIWGLSFIARYLQECYNCL